MKAWWQSLAQREKILVIGAIPIIFLMLLYGMVLQPWQKRIHEEQIRLEDNKKDLIVIKHMVKEIEALQNTNTPRCGNVNSSILAVVDREVKLANLKDALKRIEPQGNKIVRLNFEEVAFDDLITWLEQLERKYCIIVDTVSISKEKQQGLVQARITLEK